jgi:hypothetical protein
MPILPRNVLKEYFMKGDKPTEGQFGSLLDSTLNLVDDRYLVGLRTYDPAKLYVVGDTAIFSNALYQCIVNTTGAFNPTHWQVIATLGAVVYVGAWNASSNSPTLSDSSGTKGYYYVVSVSGTQNLGSGPIDFQVSDWVIYNGSVWQKVDNSEAPVDAADVSFTPTGSITSTNVQDAIVEVNNDMTLALVSKADKVNGAVVNDIAILDSNGNLADGGKQLTDYLDKNNSTTYTPTGNYNPATKLYVDSFHDTTKADKVTGATANDIALLDASGNLLDSGMMTSDFLSSSTVAADIPFTPTGGITATNVQDAVVQVNTLANTTLATKADKVSGATANDIAILNASGNLVDGGKQLSDYLDKNNTTVYTPSEDYNPATKLYVDSFHDSTKADKVSGATANDIAILNASGNLVDGGKSLSDYLDKNNTTAYTPTGNYNPATKLYVDSFHDSTKADKVTGAVVDDIAVLNASGNLVDGGKKLSDYLSKTNTTSYDPTLSYHPATKLYVDNGLNTKLNLSGGTMTGLLTLSANPSAALGAATKQYVDAAVAGIPGQVKVVVIPFTFDAAYFVSATSLAYARIPLQVTIPAAADVFPGATTISAKLYLDYLTQNGSPNATGEAALTEWTLAMNASSPTAVSGSLITLGATGNAWVKIISSSFSLSPSKSYQVILRKTAGGGTTQVQIEGGTLVLVYS